MLIKNVEDYMHNEDIIYKNLNNSILSIKKIIFIIIVFQIVIFSLKFLPYLHAFSSYLKYKIF